MELCNYEDYKTRTGTTFRQQRYYYKQHYKLYGQNLDWAAGFFTLCLCYRICPVLYNQVF